MNPPAAGPDVAWRVETNGIGVIPDTGRHGRPAELFSIWFAANISVLAVTYGGYLVVFYGLDLWQAVVVATVGIVVSFALVGVIGAAGIQAGAPTQVLSRSAFGRAGNAVPTIVSYITLVGFEIVSASLAALATQTVLGRLHLGHGTVALAVAFAVIALVAVAVSVLGHATIVAVQTGFTVVFGALTVAFVILELPQIPWHRVAALPPGHLLGGMGGGLSIIMAGTGITWVNAAADYSRYLDRRSRPSSVVGWTIVGSSLPLVVLVLLGALLAAGNPAIATSANPIGTLAAPLPTWFLVPYMVTAVGGLVATMVLGSYSSGLNLLALGVPLRRSRSVVIDGALMVAGSIYILFVSPSFFAPFQGFLLTVSVPLSAWAAIFLVDRWPFRRRPALDKTRTHDLGSTRDPASPLEPAVKWAGIVSLTAATVIGIGLVTSTSAAFSWAGYLLPLVGGRHGAIGDSSIGLIVGFAVAGLLYPALRSGLPSAPSRFGRPGRQ
jgi:NCS1 family nucleobase:cation symporter-1